MRAAARLLLALPVALDNYLAHVPAYTAAVLVCALLAVLARRGWDWCRQLAPRFVLALLFVLACLLLTDTEKGERPTDHEKANA